MQEHTTLRTRLAGWSMTIGGLALVVPALLGPPNGSDSTRQRLADLAAHPGPTLAKSLVFQAAVLLLLPGVCSIAGRVRGRGTVAVVSGAVVFGAGLVGVFSFILMTGVEVSIARSGPVNGSMVDAADAMSSSPAAVPAFVLALLLFHLLGLPWLGFGMVRAGQLPLAAAVVGTVGTCCAFFGSGTRVETVGWVLVGLTLAFIGSTLLRPRVTAKVAPAPMTQLA